MPAVEVAAFGRVQDVGPLLAALKGAGLSAAGMEANLAARGVKTKRGAAWRCSHLTQTLKHLEAGGRVLGVLTGPAFVHGVEPLGPACRSECGARVCPGSQRARKAGLWANPSGD